MRIILVLGMLLAATVANAADPSATTITGEELERLVGRPLSAISDKCGAPTDVAVLRFSKLADDKIVSDDCVQFGYGSFAFLAQSKDVVGCVYLPGWKDPVHGVRLGDTIESATAVLGNDFIEAQRVEGAGSAAAGTAGKPSKLAEALAKKKKGRSMSTGAPNDYTLWELKDKRIDLVVYADQDKKITRIEVRKWRD